VLANEYIENIVATIESGVVAVDSSRRVTIFNRAAEELTGQGRPETVAALPAVLTSLLTATVADGVARTEPESALTAGAHTRPVMFATSPLRDPAGAVLGAVAVFSDLTPLKQLEAERGRAERLAYFEALASSIAHEIKNPLVGIKTFAQLMPRRQHDERFVEEFGRVATREIGRMERLVQRLSALSRSSERTRQRVDVREPLTDAVEFLKPAFEEKRIAVTPPAGAPPRFVLADRNELEQLFINLLMNAYEATPPDGAVAVEVAGTDEYVTVGVADSGPGIPPELLERVFDPFYTTKQRGSGLGLTICAGIATAHRAKLRAANRPGGGALFTVEFPVAVAVEAPDPRMTGPR
jgi:signal transduction histidine kinase